MPADRMETLLLFTCITSIVALVVCVATAQYVSFLVRRVHRLRKQELEWLQQFNEDMACRHLHDYFHRKRNPEGVMLVQAVQAKLREKKPRKSATS